MAHFLVDATLIKFGQKQTLPYLIEKEGIFMGIRKERLRRKIADGSYDTIHLETSSDVVLLSDGSGLLEDELAKVKPIEKGGTGSITAEEAMWSLINGCETLDTAEAGDWFFVLDKDAQTVKKISLEELKKFSGGSSEPEEPSTNPNWPNKDDLVLGNTITWIGAEWIVSHVTNTEVYLTMNDTIGEGVFQIANSYCDQYLSTIPEESQTCLKEVGTLLSKRKVFMASSNQMNGGFSYFRSNISRKLGVAYWCSDSSDIYGNYGSYVDEQGRVIDDNDSYQGVNGIRPSVCIDLTLYE